MKTLSNFSRLLFTSNLIKYSVLGTQPVRFRGVKKKPHPNDAFKTPKIKHHELRGFQFNDGDFVQKDAVLVKQRGLDFYPGLNVKLNPDNWELLALEEGIFIITTEKLSPYPDSPIYPAIKAGRVVEKPFVHVLAKPLLPIFKSIDDGLTES